MRFFISLLAVAGLLLAASLLGAQQKGFDKEPKQKASDAETKPKDSEVKKKQKEEEKKAKEDFEKRKKDLSNRFIYGRKLSDWIKDLSNPDPSIKEAAIKTIASNYGVWGGAAVPKLIPLLSDRDAGIKVNTCLALGEIGMGDQDEKTSQTAVKELTRLLSDTQSIVRFHAATALGRVGMTTDAKAALPKLVAMLTQYPDYGSYEIRRAVATALGVIGYDSQEGPNRQAVYALITALGDHCSQVRLQAILSLGTLGAPRPADRTNVLNAVYKAINDPKQNPVVVIWARVLYVQLTTGKDKKPPDPKQVGPIVRMLKHADLNVRTNAAQALAMIQAKSAIQDLIDVIKTDDEEQAGLAAANALRVLEKDVTVKHILSLGELCRFTRTEFRVRGPQVLALFGPNAKPALEDLAFAIKEAEKNPAKEKEFIISIIDCLGAMGERPAAGAIPDLQRLSRHPDEDISFAARAVLKFWQQRPAVAPAAVAAPRE